MSKTVVTTSGQRMFTFLIVGWNADPLVRMVTSREPIAQPSRHVKQSEPIGTPYRNLGRIRSARSGVETPWRFDAR
jgi:hypothetical protein